MISSSLTGNATTAALAKYNSSSDRNQGELPVPASQLSFTFPIRIAKLAVSSMQMPKTGKKSLQNITPYGIMISWIN